MFSAKKTKTVQSSTTSALSLFSNNSNRIEICFQLAKTGVSVLSKARDACTIKIRGRESQSNVHKNDIIRIKNEITALEKELTPSRRQYTYDAELVANRLQILNGMRREAGLGPDDYPDWLHKGAEKHFNHPPFLANVRKLANITIRDREDRLATLRIQLLENQNEIRIASSKNSSPEEMANKLNFSLNELQKVLREKPIHIKNSTLAHFLLLTQTYETITKKLNTIGETAGNIRECKEYFDAKNEISKQNKIIMYHAKQILNPGYISTAPAAVLMCFCLTMLMVCKKNENYYDTAGMALGTFGGALLFCIIIQNCMYDLQHATKMKFHDLEIESAQQFVQANTHLLRGANAIEEFPHEVRKGREDSNRFFQQTRNTIEDAGNNAVDKLYHFLSVDLKNMCNLL